MEVSTQDGDGVSVIEVIKTTQRASTYNLTVADAHTFFVGNDGIWVHNTDCFRSRIDENPTLVREAERAARDSIVQRDLDNLTNALKNRNTAAGLGPAKSLGGGLFELRSRSGARVYFRNVEGGFEVLGKSSKANQNRVINAIRSTFF